MDPKITSHAAIKEIFPYYGTLDEAYMLGIQLNKKSKGIFSESKKSAAENDFYERKDADLELKTVDDLTEVSANYPAALGLFQIREQVLRDENDIEEFTKLVQEIEPWMKFREIFVSLHHNKAESHSFVIRELEKVQSSKKDLNLDNKYNILVEELKEKEMLSCLSSFLNYNDTQKREVKYVKNLVIRLSKEDEIKVVEERIKTFKKIQSFEYRTLLFQLIPDERDFYHGDSQYFEIFQGLSCFESLQDSDVGVCCYESMKPCRKGLEIKKLSQQFLRIPVYFSTSDCKIILGNCPGCLNKAFMPNVKNICSISFSSDKMEFEFKENISYLLHNDDRSVSIDKWIIKQGKMYCKFPFPSHSIPLFDRKQLHLVPFYCSLSLSGCEESCLNEYQNIKLPDLSLMGLEIAKFQIESPTKIRCTVAKGESLKSLDCYSQLSPLEINFVKLSLSDWIDLKEKEKDYNKWTSNVGQIEVNCQDLLDPKSLKEILLRLALLDDWQKKVISLKNIYQVLMILEYGEHLYEKENFKIKCEEKPNKVQLSMLEAAYKHLDPSKFEVILPY